ncbi:hypothetical protein FGKAn22_05860 [Ferrigenium kumadai]|uniref:Uncharacterized protein n=1 Tax=Ferrigenium kumadai TaxID=1682490 RepID=A0AAN1SXR8_9PROT|nr:hypothetical protein [Ferrigenium kumadai]BBI98893.1 hypothetical protein FGKAn22_05860 [Ferrigenium kumadai]
MSASEQHDAIASRALCQAMTYIKQCRAWCVLLWLLPAAAYAAEISLNVADIVAPDFSARGIALTLPQDGSAELSFDELHVQRHEFRRARLHCARFDLSTTEMSCRGGSLDKLPGVAMEFGYRFRNGEWRFSAQLHNAPAKGLAAFLSADMPRPTHGALDGTLHAAGDGAGASELGADLQLADVGFSDAAGLHAAEKLRGTMKLAATRSGKRWNWQGDIAWQSGELFWQPLYLAGSGGRSLSASGSFDGTYLVVDRAVAVLPQIGSVQFAAQWDVKQSALVEASAHGDDLALERLFADYAKPFLAQSALAEATLSGHADVDWSYRDGATQALRLTLRDAGIADAQQRFAWRGVNTAIEWQPDAVRAADIAFAGGELLGVPFGSAKWQVQMHGLELGMNQAVLPLLDGKLELRDLRLWRAGNDWRWQFGAALSGISMEQVSRAMGWPEMLGTLAGRIPRVSYDGAEIRTDGALLFNVFDGTVVASQLRLVEPFGRAPRLYGNLSMRELDLDLLTHTFSFGNMQGRIDADVSNLELQDWLPARFDARIESSPGNYPKKISQKAVQNISALGGAGAAAAIQRSYLRFFENFGYDRIGWRCALRNGVCAMGGVDNGNGGAYAIVKGGGIPAITVMGYNRSVSWDELVTRLKRVTQGNMQAVVK